MSADCPHCAYWRDLTEKSVAHAQTYGPRIADLMIENQRLKAGIEACAGKTPEPKMVYCTGEDKGVEDNGL